MTRKSGRRGGNTVTIHDVARHAGVSPMTVSRVINAESNVRETTRAQVAASIKALDYSPNMAARSLASADAMHIGILYANPSASYLSETLLGSMEQSRLSGCQLMIEKFDPGEGERAAVQRLVKGGVDGLVLPAPLCDSEAVLNAVAEAALPAVLLASGRPAPGLCAVSINDLEAARAMTRHLIGLGHTRIGFITGAPDQTASGQRQRGYIEAMTEAGLAVDAVMQGHFSYRSGLEAAEKLLAVHEPTAIFASNDDMAAAAAAVAHRQGLDIPGDLSIAGFDDSMLATTIWPELTTVRQPIADMAREAVRLLIEQIRGRRSGPVAPAAHKLLKFTLIKRGSTGPAPEKPRPRRKSKV